MLGKHHIALSVGTVLPFLIPLFFIDSAALTYAIAFLFAVFVGSLTPDADCGGKATIYYRFPIVDFLMKKAIIKPVVFVFRMLSRNKKIKLKYEVREEHRGIMHAPIGILISSFMFTIIILIFMLIFKLFNIYTLLLVFLGLLVGQFLHLLEDSCTVAGIDWKFPFGTKKIYGNIYTFSKYEGKIDIRPKIYQYILGAFSLLLLLGYAFDKIIWPLWLVYLCIFLIVGLLWLSFLTLSGMLSQNRETPPHWLKKVEQVKKIRHFHKDFGKSFKQKSSFGIKEPKVEYMFQKPKRKCRSRKSRRKKRK